MEKTVVRTEAAPAPFQGAPYNQAISVGDFVFVAGQLGLKPGETAIEGDITQMFHSSQINDNGDNFIHYINPELDKAIDAAKSTVDAERRMPLWHKCHQILYEDQPYTFLYAPKTTRVLDKKIVIVEREPDGRERYVKIYPTKGGNISYYFNRWRKLDHTPDF